MKKILFVCTGNTCRSPMAAALMNKLLRERGVGDVTAESAGLAAAPGEPASRNAVRAAAEEGAELSGHHARRVSPEIVRDACLILAMTSSHAAALKAEFPGFSGKIRVLGGGIPDPFGGDLADYRRCRDAILAALKPLTEECTQ